MIRAVVTDIEGTTSSLSFVKDVLFPYARSHLPEFVRGHAQEATVRGLLKDTVDLAGRALSDEDAVEQLLAWIDADRKATPLKSLQGLIWEAGYRNGDFQGHIYEDAARKLREWTEQGLKLYVYSSGSVYAQKLLFGHTVYGDLTPLFSGYFDTHIGAKQEASSYTRIAEAAGMAPADMLFLSDIGAELDAARAAGMQTCQLLRDGAQPDPAHQQAANFDAILPDA
ncbi:acireductone synthase [Methyloterricola oryzae]|uniref:acireductone synthase n=1 Tax=Methyloterricola oryzae TaxID=1495050 RepID=UPI0005EB83A2|nr:acireductone synthase [Methyloterricola oryzae]